MKIQQLIYALEIAKTGSMNQAANNLHITQPTISAALKELESTVGFLIFKRTNKGMKTTTKGLEFLLRSEPLVKNYQDLLDTYTICDDKSKKTLSISSQHYNFVVAAFIQLVNTYSDSEYSFTLRETQTLETIKDVSSMDSEIGFIYTSKNNYRFINRLLEDSAIQFHSMAKLLPSVFLSSTHPLAAREKISLTDLKDYPMIVYQQKGSDLLNEEYVHIPDHKKIIYTKDRGTTNNLISQTDGFNIGTGIVSDLVEPSNIIAIPLSNANGYMEIGWISSKDSEPSSLAYEFIDLAKKIVTPS